MMTLTLVSLSLTLAALFLSIFALIAVRRSSALRLSRQLSELSTALEDQMLSIRSLKVRVSALTKPKNARGQFARSEDGSQETDVELDGDAKTRDAEAWKKQMNARLALRGMPR